MVQLHSRVSLVALFLLLVVNGSLAQHFSPQTTGDLVASNPITVIDTSLAVTVAESLVGTSLTLHKPARYSYQVVSVNPPEVSAEAVYVWSPQDGRVLYEKNSTIKRPVASLTKIASALTAVRTMDLSQTVHTPMTVNGVIGSNMGLIPGESVGAWGLVQGMLIASGNDAAFSLAMAHSFGYAGFVSDMNDTVLELQLKDTHFTNPIGYDDSENYSTARDMALLAWELLQDPKLAEIVRTQEVTVVDSDARTVHKLRSTNELLTRTHSISGVKTGTSQLAGQNLIASQEDNNHVLIVVILGSSDRFNDAQNLIDWARRVYTF